jgi:hypothetical protein
MGLYFQGRETTDEAVVKQLSTTNHTCKHIGNRIWIWHNPKTGKTIITGDEGNGYCVKLAEGSTEEEAMRKLEDKKRLKQVFNELFESILAENPEAT